MQKQKGFKLVMYDLEQRIINLEARFNQLVRVGTVSSVDPAGTARVKLPDADGMESYSLRILVPKTQDDKYYYVPDVGEQVLCVFLPIGLEQGFIIGSYYSQVDAAIEANRDLTSIKFKDGTSIEYDRDKHRLSISAAVAQVDLTTLNLSIVGPVNIQGDLSVSGSVIDAGGNTNHHSH